MFDYIEPLFKAAIIIIIIVTVIIFFADLAKHNKIGEAFKPYMFIGILLTLWDASRIQLTIEKNTKYFNTSKVLKFSSIFNRISLLGCTKQDSKF